MTRIELIAWVRTRAADLSLRAEQLALRCRSAFNYIEARQSASDYANSLRHTWAADRAEKTGDPTELEYLYGHN